MVHLADDEITWTPRQQEVFDEVTTGQCDRVLMVGPVRAGKTFVAVHAFMTWATSMAGTHEFIIASRTTRQMTQAIVKPIENW